jgi:hypothetical protein
MNTERERFEDWYKQEYRVPDSNDNWCDYLDDEIGYKSLYVDNSWVAWRHQAATIADLQQQLTEANRRGEELAEIVSELNRSAGFSNCGLTSVSSAILHKLATATSKRGGE